MPSPFAPGKVIACSDRKPTLPTRRNQQKLFHETKREKIPSPTYRCRWIVLGTFALSVMFALSTSLQQNGAAQYFARDG